MKSLKFLLIPLLLAGLAASDAAWADRGGHHHGHFQGSHRHSGVFIAAPLFYPWYTSPYPYYAPYPYYSPPLPPVYVEQGDAPSGQGGYWYHCDSPSGYYPYVRECPAGWSKRVPTPTPY